MALSESVTDDSGGDCGPSVFIVSVRVARFTAGGSRASFSPKPGFKLQWVSGESAESAAVIMPRETLGTVVVAIFERHDGQRSDRVMGRCKNSDGLV